MRQHKAVQSVDGGLQDNRAEGDDPERRPTPKDGHQQRQQHIQLNHQDKKVKVELGCSREKQLGNMA